MFSVAWNPEVYPESSQEVSNLIWLYQYCLISITHARRQKRNLSSFDLAYETIRLPAA